MDLDLSARDGGPKDLGESFKAIEPLKTGDFSVSKAKSSHRLTFEAQVKVLKESIGDLEIIRSKLGLSQRKMTQLLMVDPSAWTRWTREGEDAPPHIYRSLQWYLALQDKFPGLNPGLFLPSEYYSRQDSKLQKNFQEEVLKRQEFERVVTAQSILLEDQNAKLRRQILGLQKRLILTGVSLFGAFLLLTMVLLFK